MCIVQLPTGGNPLVVNKYMKYQLFPLLNQLLESVKKVVFEKLTANQQVNTYSPQYVVCIWQTSDIGKYRQALV
jgi:hypothetical protein